MFSKDYRSIESFTGKSLVFGQRSGRKHPLCGYNCHIDYFDATHDMKMLSTSDTVVWIKDGRIDRIAGKEELNINIGSIDGATVA